MPTRVATRAALRWCFAFAAVCAALYAHSQTPVLDYVLAVNPSDCTSVQITLRARNLPAKFHLAMVRHFLIDDHSWNSVEGLHTTSGKIERVQDGLWRIDGAGKDATVGYKVRLDPASSHVVGKPLLTPTGGLLGDLHMFMYVPEAAGTAAHVILKLPQDWHIATALTPTSDPHIFYARNALELSDSPILVGHLREWRFQVDQTPIRVVYWPLPDANSFDAEAMVNGLKKIVQEASNIFGGLPWREYLFQIRDGSDVEGFEHFNCVTLGLPSKSLASNPHVASVTVAHEFFHAWNMMRIHPAEYTGPDYRSIEISELWFSEGFTMFYADLLARRAHLPTQEPTRMAHLEELITSYLANPDNAHFSAEQSSRVAFRMTAELHPDVWVVGELLAAVLDLIIRDETGGRKSLDDLMRAMFAEFSGERGFTTEDVERVAGKVCGRSVRPLFDAYVRHASTIDFKSYLRNAGMRLEVGKKKAMLPDGTPIPDIRAQVTFSSGKSLPSLSFAADSVWSRAGLHRGDLLEKLNGAAVKTESDFYDRLRAMRVRDQVTLEVLQAGKKKYVTFALASFDWPEVKICEFPDASNRQRDILKQWNSGR